MKVYAKMIEKREYNKLMKRICDLCGKESTTSGEMDWDGYSYKINGYSYKINGYSYKINETEIRVIVRQKEGESYPEGGSGIGYEIDVCPDCFKNRLIPWFKKEGAKIKFEEWEW